MAGSFSTQNGFSSFFWILVMDNALSLPGIFSFFYFFLYFFGDVDNVLSSPGGSKCSSFGFFFGFGDVDNVLLSSPGRGIGS